MIAGARENLSVFFSRSIGYAQKERGSIALFSTPLIIADQRFHAKSKKTIAYLRIDTILGLALALHEAIE